MYDVSVLMQADTVLQQAEFDTANLTHPSTSAEETDGPFGAADSSLKDRLVALFASEVVKKTRRYTIECFWWLPN